MAIDKSLYEAPQGLDALVEEPDIEIEVEEPESVTVNVDGLEVEIEPNDEGDDDFEANLAENLPESVLSSIATELMEGVDNDMAARSEWLDAYVDGISLLGLKDEERTEPWEGACSVYHPVLTEALVKFQAETMMETFPAAGPVKTQVIGKYTKEKEEAAARVKDDMNYQLTEVMPEYRSEHERMLWGLGLSGNAFKKVYFDPSLRRQVSVYVPAEDVVVPYGASDLRTAPRVTHIMRKTQNELAKLQAAGFYVDVELGDPADTMDDVEKKIAERLGFRATSDDRYKLLEIQADLDIEGYEDTDEDGEPTGIALPYVVTIEKASNTVLSIRRNWSPDDKTKQKRQHFVHYGYIPAFGFYCFGLIHLIGAYAKSGTMILRQLVDAGTLSNLPGGFKSNGLRVKGDDTPISPGEFRDVDVASGSIRENILPLPYKEPSQVLQGLMDNIIAEARNLASAADMKISDMSANSPVGTTLAILERTLKVMSAVQARIHYAMKQEFRLLKNIIRDFSEDEYTYDPDTATRAARETDYDMVEVIPVSDPNSATMSQKVVQYQAVMQLAQQSPQLYDLAELHKQMLEVLGIRNIGKLIPSTDDKKPQDPVAENMNIINGKPVKAFIHQDHEAHIQVHMAAMQDPMILQLMANNPSAQAIQAAAMAHVNEHIAFAYRRKIEEQLGAALPAPDEVLPNEVEVQLSPLVAQAAQQLLQNNQAQAQQQQAQQQAQDPLVQMQQKELELKERELMLKEKQHADNMAIQAEKISSSERVAGAKIGADAVKTEKQLNTQQLLAGAKMGMDAIAQNKESTLNEQRAGVSSEQDRGEAPATS